MASWAVVRSSRGTDPPTVLPYKGYVPVGSSFNARVAIQDIIERVEKDFPPGTLTPLVDLIDAINALEGVQTTHCAAKHAIGRQSELLTSVIVMPRANDGHYIFWERAADVTDSATRFSQHLWGRFTNPFSPERLTFTVGPIEVIVNPQDSQVLGYGLEFQIAGRGQTIAEAIESWEWAVFALSEHMRSMDPR